MPATLFDLGELATDHVQFKSLTPDQSTGSEYYLAILQNLFFATLNQEMDARRFKVESSVHPHPDFSIKNVYRHAALFKDKNAAAGLFRDVPFLNGGLFECLDEEEQKTLIDGFSDKKSKQPTVPNLLFFQEERTIFEALNEDYGTKNKKYEVRGLIHILQDYKFTIAENTPLEEEVALDPELLGRIFENLLASYNPETKTTARKQTGSFYTPREIVQYMVDESLLAYLTNKLTEGHAGSLELGKTQIGLFGGQPNKKGQIALEASPNASHWQGREPELDQKLRLLFAETGHNLFTDEQDLNALINALDACKILDPACGSGAFPMGILHRMVGLLHRLDPQNTRWKNRQLQKAAQIDDANSRHKATEAIERAFSRNGLDYGRKLYLIEYCIYGVDIQPIAVQIAKLRFFISLIADQNTDDTQENRGILALPNLETKFVAANTLIGLENANLAKMAVEDLLKERESLRHDIFSADRYADKKSYRKKDEKLRAQIKATLDTLHMGGQSEQLADWNPFDQNASAPFFDPQWMFGIDKGFDVVIGNPPYVRADVDKEHTKLRRAVEASGLYETLWEKWDLFVAFVERGYKLLKHKGIVTLIVSDAYCHAKYAEKSQNWFLKNSLILRLDFLSELQVFDAAVRNVIFFYQRANGQFNQPELRLHKNSFGNFSSLSSTIQSEATHRIFSPAEKNAFEISVPNLRLEQICYISVGMVVHADERVAKGEFELKDLVTNSKDKIHSKPFVEGKYLHRWLPEKNKWLEWNTERAPSKFRRPTFIELYQVPEKLISVDISGGGTSARVAYDNCQLFHNHSAWSFVLWHNLKGVRNKSLQNVAKYSNEKPRPEFPRREVLEKESQGFNLKFVLSIMNSAFAWNFLQSHRRSNLHIFPDDWKPLLIPKIHISAQSLFVHLVTLLLHVKAHAHPAHLTQTFERVLDGMVCELYFGGMMREKEVDILTQVERDLAPFAAFESLPDAEKDAAIQQLHGLWTHTDSPVRNRLALMPVRSADVLGVILGDK